VGDRCGNASQKVESLGVFNSRSSSGPLPSDRFGRDAQVFRTFSGMCGIGPRMALDHSMDRGRFVFL
jgi:hypothetical protein